MGRRSRSGAGGSPARSPGEATDAPARARWRRSRGADRPKRRIREREAPGSVLGGPPIAVTCECGTKHDLRYGEAWTCECCGRRWDTNQIPREQYEVVRRTQLRFLAVAIFFTLSGNVFSVFFLLPVGLSAWFVFLRPLHRRRYRAAIADLPRWELHPE
jgi:hypothetical protein